MINYGIRQSSFFLALLLIKQRLQASTFQLLKMCVDFTDKYALNVLPWYPPTKTQKCHRKQSLFNKISNLNFSSWLRNCTTVCDFIMCWVIKSFFLLHYERSRWFSLLNDIILTLKVLDLQDWRLGKEFYV